MFEKIFPKQTRRRHGLWWWMAFFFACAIGVLLGTNISLLIFASTSVVALTLLQGFSTWLAYVLSLGLAGLIGVAFLVGYLWTYAGASAVYEAAKAYSHANGLKHPWPQWLVVGMEVFLITLDLISLWYRREFFASKGAEALFWFFVVLSLLSPLLGLLMHVLANKPLNYRMREARQKAANLVGDDVMSLIDQMDSRSRTRLLFDPDGGAGAINDFFTAEQEKANADAREQESERDRKQAAEQERLARQQENNRPLALNPAGGTVGSSNGHQPKS